jgi:hypothetical protein
MVYFGDQLDYDIIISYCINIEGGKESEERKERREEA